MVDEPAAAAGEHQSPTDASPKRLMREALSLALILGLTLGVSVLERRNFIPWQGYPSSLLLLVLCLWHWKRFRIGLRLFRPETRRRVFPLVFSAVLVSMLLLFANVPLSPKVGYASSYLRLLHLIVIVPLSEELYFRGLLLEHLRRGFSAVHAVVLCTLLFGLLHLPVGAGLLAGGLSLVACILVLRNGSLVHAFQLHVAWNAVTQISRMSVPSTRWLWAATASVMIAALAAGSYTGRSTRDSTP
jgi:membrane protease YdiL (CAAX protease family)